MTGNDRRLDEWIVARIADAEEMRRLLPVVREHRLRCPEGRPTEARDEQVILECLVSLDRLGKAAAALRGRAPQPMTGPRCLVCGRYSGPFRHGLDGRCRMRWERAGRPDLDEWIAAHVPSSGSVVPSPVTPIRTVISDGESVTDGRRLEGWSPGVGRQGPTAAA